jgi:hypothetical protein
VAKFVKHESCPQCGSRDNLGRYSDGSAFCFGCHYTERGTHSPFVGERDGKNESTSDGIRFPDDATNVIGAQALEWLSKYSIGVDDVLRAKFKWSPYWEQLLMPFYDRDRQLVCLQAKNFNPKRASKAKYYNIGDKNEAFTVYGTRGNTLVLTEDAVSALKVSKIADAMPLLGTTLPRNKLGALRASYGRLIVWLDRDKWREGREIADAAKLLGLSTMAILTDKDPKEFSLEDIKGLIQ